MLVGLEKVVSPKSKGSLAEGRISPAANIGMVNEKERSLTTPQVCRKQNISPALFN
jgi:hypothetical protein